MGVGKSTIGKMLAKSLGVSFIDCDQTLERQMGVSVNTIFDIEGESGFRTRETRLLKALAEQKTGVIATGGGIVTQAENRALLKQKGGVIYLDASVNLLWSRLRYCKNRPLLQTDNPKSRLAALLEARDPLYREVATRVIKVNKGPARNVVNQIVQLLASESTQSTN